MTVPKSLNSTFAKLTPSATVAINEHCAALARAGKQVFKLGLGQSPFPVPQSVVESLRRNAHQKDYLPVLGLLELRQAVARYHAEREGIETSADRVLVGPGSKELMFLLQLAYNGELLVPSPSWVSYAPQARLLGRTVTFLPTTREDAWRLRADTLRAHCEADPNQARVLILNTPNNPVGGCYPEAELRALAEVARDVNLLVLSDEIYGEIQHDGRHTSIARFYPQGTIISAGLSKWCGAGGWRLGTFTFPAELDWLCQALRVAASETFTSVSAPIQYAAVSAFPPGPDLQQYLQKSRSVLAALADWIVARLRDADIHCPDATGGFYIFGDATAHAESLASRGINSSRSFCSALLDETGVAVLPGCDFGRPEEELTFRAAYVNFDGEAALANAHGSLDEAFLHQHCGDVLEAFDRLCRWTQGA
jgi:aspartate aminotransferase